jgi:RHH-type transcriptional regulator, proline utilization regulon repressor / proline dehydrogenase / delta 1-pyrroline-5-carboxylate dehydrogenase
MVSAANQLLDQRIQAVGHDLFSRTKDHTASMGALEKIEQRVMARVLSADAVKTQLFRFVDTLPALRSAGEISRHLDEYLSLTGHSLLAGVSHLPWVAEVAARQVQRIARRFIAADDLHGTLRVARELRERRLAFTIDILGEAVVCESEADAYQRKYLELIPYLAKGLAGCADDPLVDGGMASAEADPAKMGDDNFRAGISRVNASIKLSALYSQFDPIDPRGTTRGVLARLRPIFRCARKHGAIINFDMEQFAYKDLTLRIFRQVLSEEEFRDWEDVGIAMQAYLRATSDDLRELAEWVRRRGTPVWVRLVKGAYWDYERVVAEQNNWPSPVFEEKSETDAAFEAGTKFLIEHHELLRPAIASHNIRSIAAAMAMAEEAGLEKRACEFQMLYGMADAIASALVDLGYRVRIYAPVGKLLPGMAYLVRRLLENSSNQSFLRAGFVEHAPEEELLMNPIFKTRVRPVEKSQREFVNQPLSDFSREDARHGMSEAIERVRETLPLTRAMVIGGKERTTGQWIEAFNPSRVSQLVSRCAKASANDAEMAVAAAKRAFDTWRDAEVEERAGLLERVAEILARDRFKLAAVEVFECGKPWREADADVAEAIDFCRYYAEQMRKMGAPHGVTMAGEENRWNYEARGVAVIIAPWNFPLAILCGMTAAAVVTGNTAIMKPAEQSSLVASYLMDAFAEAGAPAGVVNYLPGVGEEIGPVLVGHADVAMVAFTGSRAVGLAINQAAGEARAGQDHIKRVIVELGGKNAIIVDDDADLDEAVTGIVASAFGYAGQKCSACSRLITLPGNHEALLARVIEATKSLAIAPAEEPESRVGPVIDGEAAGRIRAAIERGKKEATLAYGGDVGELARQGHFIAPHIFTDVAPDSFLAREEIFGPVLAVLRARDFDHAMELANSTDYALTGGIYSRSPSHIERAEREFRAGNLYINRKITGALVGRQPFGGFKLSGGGTQAGGPDYLRNFVWPRCVTENTLRHGFAPEMNVAAQNGNRGGV